jgi:IS5 family transposase
VESSCYICVMYVQCSTVKRKGKDGRNRKLVEAYRDPQTGQPRNRTVQKLEKLPILERSRLIFKHGGQKYLDTEEWKALVDAGDFVYSKKFNQSSGAKAISPRIIIGALIIKHKLNLSDEETLQTISENPYMQFFLGLDDYSPEILFSPSLFVEIRKRLGQDTFNEFSELIMSLSLNPSSTQKGDEQPSNQGKLKIDATVADQYIRYPNDLSLVNEARLKSEKIIDQLYILLKDEFPVKPRTYRKVAHQRYLQEAKKKQKSAKSVRKAIRYLLNCVERNLRYIDAMLDKFHGVEFPLANKYQKRLWVIHTLYDQQRKMYDEKSHTCTDRIVSISQPHVRPIVRGKQGKPVEFGSKLGLSLIDGYMIHETLSWEAYNESKDLQKQAETYKLLLGYYPELIQADKIYATNENRIWCKERNILTMYWTASRTMGKMSSTGRWIVWRKALAPYGMGSMRAIPLQEGCCFMI